MLWNAIIQWSIVEILLKTLQPCHAKNYFCLGIVLLWTFGWNSTTIKYLPHQSFFIKEEREAQGPTSKILITQVSPQQPIPWAYHGGHDAHGMSYEVHHRLILWSHITHDVCFLCHFIHFWKERNKRNKNCLISTWAIIRKQSFLSFAHFSQFFLHKLSPIL